METLFYISTLNLNRKVTIREQKSSLSRQTLLPDGTVPAARTPFETTDERDVRQHSRIDTLNEILDFAVDNDVDITDILANRQAYSEDIRALIETILERVIEQRMTRLQVGSSRNDSLNGRRQDALRPSRHHGSGSMTRKQPMSLPQSSEAVTQEVRTLTVLLYACSYYLS